MKKTICDLCGKDITYAPFKRRYEVKVKLIGRRYYYDLCFSCQKEIRQMIMAKESSDADCD